jgi:hypothetical protein
VVLIVEDYRWIPLGAGFGALGANLWVVLCSRVESVANPPVKRTLGADPAGRWPHVTGTTGADVPCSDRPGTDPGGTGGGHRSQEGSQR